MSAPTREPSGVSGSAANWSCCWPSSLRVCLQCREGTAQPGPQAGHGHDTTVQAQKHQLPDQDAELLHARHQGPRSPLGQQARRAASADPTSRVARHAAMMAGRCTHAKPFSRPPPPAISRILRSRLGRLIQDIGREIAGHQDMDAAFALPLAPAHRSDQRPTAAADVAGSFCSFHAPETECIGKGKASAPYKGSASRSPSLPPTPAPRAVSSCCMPRRCPATRTTGTPCATSSTKPKNSPGARSSAPLSTRGTADTMRKIHAGGLYISGQKRGVFGVIKRELRRRSAIEPVIGLTSKPKGHTRPVLSQRPRRAAAAITLCTLGSRLQLPPHPRMAEGSFAPNPEGIIALLHSPAVAQIGFLTVDALLDGKFVAHTRRC